MIFYLGTHEPSWLRRSPVPLFVSARRLSRLRRHRPAICRWALDSGGFSELAMHGEWKTSEAEYIEAVRRFVAEIGRLDWAAPQDWMCEPSILAKTGGTVAEHQARTIRSVSELRAADLPTIPVLQGWRPGDYLDHVEEYARAGFDLVTEPVVGLGSVCRRQDMAEAAEIVFSLQPLALHGFGVKVTGLQRYGGVLLSADSMAWSYNARRNPPLEGCSHASCANCYRWAMRWREAMLEPRHQQRQLWGI